MFRKKTHINNTFIILVLCVVGGNAKALNAASLPIMPICENVSKVIEVTDEAVKLHVFKAGAANTQPKYPDEDPKICELEQLPEIISYDLCGIDPQTLTVGTGINAVTQRIYSGGWDMPIEGQEQPPMIEKNCLKSFETITMKMTK